MLLRPEGPYIVARLPVQPQKYCALRARQYSMPWWAPTGWIETGLYKRDYMRRWPSVGHPEQCEESSDTTFKN